MSQYQPVSLNTIRAAIMWGGLPTPRLKQVWVFKPSNRPPWSTVQATFSLSEILRKYSPRPHRYSGLDDLTPFRRQLIDCFARDITVVELYILLSKDELVARLACSVEKVTEKASRKTKIARFFGSPTLSGSGSPSAAPSPGGEGARG